MHMDEFPRLQVSKNTRFSQRVRRRQGKYSILHPLSNPLRVYWYLPVNWSRVVRVLVTSWMVASVAMWILKKRGAKRTPIMLVTGDAYMLPCVLGSFRTGMEGCSIIWWEFVAELLHHLS